MDKKLKLMSWPVRLPSNFFTGMLMINHPPVEGGCTFQFCKPYEIQDNKFLDELCKYLFDRLEEEGLNCGSADWEAIVATHQDFIDIMKSKNYNDIHNYLRNMWSKPLCHGMAQGNFYYDRLIENRDEIQQNTGFGIYDKFLSLLEAVSLIPAFDPEEYQQDMEYLKYYSIEPDKYFDMLEEHFECTIKAPEYQGSHFGIVTERHGFFSDRDIMALGIAIKINESYWNRKNISICDLGSGLGYVLYYLKQLGFDDLTHLDLPTISVAAKYFLQTNMPDHGIKFISPEEFDGNYDLVLNADSLVQMNKDTAEKYCVKMEKNTKHFLSINRESQGFKVSDVCQMTRVTRNPFWYRRGWIEEDYVKAK